MITEQVQKMIEEFNKRHNVIPLNSNLQAYNKPEIVYVNKEKPSVKNLGCKKCEYINWRF